MLGRSLIFVGIFVAALGGLILLAGRVPFLGRLPGDFAFSRPGFTFYFPLATSILISLLLTIAINIVLCLLNR